ncbi:hypothetical protein H0H87_006073 [Tephrocybe sp. NHM501043]|nr:hypothetical protein H0H87_006073 [Tephrocybe sp. NHM501043]
MTDLFDTSKSVLVEKFSESTTLTRDAVASGTWKSVAPVVVKGIAVALGTTLALFIFTYMPQVAICAVFSGPFAFLIAALLVLGEASAIILLISRLFFLRQALDEIFDAVLVQQGNEQLVLRGREIKSSGGVKKLGKAVTKPLSRFSKEGLLRYIITFPLNSIPVIGTILFFLYNGILGVKAGPTFHIRYFQLKGFDSLNRRSFCEKRRGAYTAFGATALALNVLPFVGLAFSFTTTVGAALWASQLEKDAGGRNNHSGTGQRLPEDEVQVEL